MIPVGTNVEVARMPKATLTIIAVNCAFFLLEALTPDEHLRGVAETFAYSPANLNPLSLIMSLFLHADFFHLFGNMLYLWIFGGPVEDRIGPRLFTYYYFGAGLWSTALWGVLEAIVHPGKPGYALGASGAISGIMALFLYRCYYGKIKMSLPILPTWLFAPWARFSIPAAPLLIYWFLRDVVGGISSYGARGGTAYWGHVGGFLFGLAVGRIRRYGHEGRVEQVRAKLQQKIETGFGWKDNQAEAELRELLELAPRDPEVHHQLARYYGETGKPKESLEHYQQTIALLFSSDPPAAAYALLEAYDAFRKPLAVHLHLKAAEALAGKRFLEDACRALAPALPVAEGILAERAHLLQVRLCRALAREDEAAAALRQFAERHPRSRSLAEAQRAMTLVPDRIFPPQPQPTALEQRRAEAEAADAAGGPNPFLYVLQRINQFVTDPWFLFLWVFLLSWGGGRSWKGVAFTFTLAFSIVAFYRVDWFHLWSMSGRRNEEAARKEAAVTLDYDRARSAERGDNYETAALFYEKVLVADPGHLQARFNLARLYGNKLGDRGNALLHYKKLAEQAPPDHPYRAEAQDAMRGTGGGA